jgi:thioredoxin-like negative regulator of GroEL
MLTTNDTSLRETLLSQEKVFIVFHSKRCGICKIFLRRFKSLEEEGKTAGITIATIEADDNPKASAAFGIQGTPHFVSFANQEVQESVTTSFFTKADAMIEQLKNIKVKTQQKPETKLPV